MNIKHTVDNEPGSLPKDSTCMACLMGLLILTFSLSVLAMISYV